MLFVVSSFLCYMYIYIYIRFILYDHTVTCCTNMFPTLWCGTRSSNKTTNTWGFDLTVIHRVLATFLCKSV